MFNVCKSHAILFDLLHKMFFQQKSKVSIYKKYISWQFYQNQSQLWSTLVRNSFMDTVGETRLVVEDSAFFVRVLYVDVDA